MSCGGVALTAMNQKTMMMQTHTITWLTYITCMEIDISVRLEKALTYFNQSTANAKIFYLLSKCLFDEREKLKRK